MANGNHNDNNNNCNNQTSGGEDESGEVERLRNQVKELKNENYELRNKNYELRNKNKELRNKNKQLEQENERLDKEITGLRNNDSVLKTTALAAIGYTPELLKFTNGERHLSPKFFALFFLFLVDLTDAVFDLILSVRTMIVGTGGAGFGLGLLLAIATILGRVVSAIYGWNVSKYPNEEAAFLRFAFMEFVVFFLEDGAAILVLANSTGGMSILETISMWLTMICGVCYIGLIVYNVIEDNLKRRGQVFFFLNFGLLPGASAIFQVYILITEVILSKDGDPPLSGGLETAAFVVYGITAVVLGGGSVWMFTIRAEDSNSVT